MSFERPTRNVFLKNAYITYSPYKREFILKMEDGAIHNMSNLVPNEVWDIGGRKFPLRPLHDWQIRKKLRKIFISYFRNNIDKNLKSDDVVF